MFSTKQLGVWVVAGLLGLGTAMAGGPVTIGSLAGSRNATLDGQSPLPNTTMLSGDRLQVGNGLAMVMLDQGNRMVLGRQTDALFLRDGRGVTVSLDRGNLSLYQSESGTGVRVQAGKVTVLPTQGFKTLGEVAMANGLVFVTAKAGTLQVEKAGTTKEVSAGKTISIATTSDASPTPAPPGTSHLKHIFSLSPKSLLVVGLAAMAGGTATAIILSSRSTKQVSAFTPGP